MQDCGHPANEDIIDLVAVENLDDLVDVEALGRYVVRWSVIRHLPMLPDGP